MKSRTSRSLVHCSVVQYAVITALLLVIAGTSGCFPFRDGYNYYPPGAINQPTGTATRQWQTAQAEKSHSDGLVLYEAAWIDGSDRLGPAATDRLARACVSGCSSSVFLTLEPSTDPAMDERRIQAIVDFANNRGTAISPESIVVARPDGNELYGEESVRIAREMMQGNQQNRGISGLGAGLQGLFGGSTIPGYYGSGR